MSYTGKPLTDEQRRILVAAHERRLWRSDTGRWLIAGEHRPDRRERERLWRRELLDWAWNDGMYLVPTESGVAALDVTP